MSEGTTPYPWAWLKEGGGSGPTVQGGQDADGTWWLETASGMPVGQVRLSGYPDSTSVVEAMGKVLTALWPWREIANDLRDRIAAEDEADVRAADEAVAEMERTGEKPRPWEEVKARLDRRARDPDDDDKGG